MISGRILQLGKEESEGCLLCSSRWAKYIHGVLFFIDALSQAFCGPVVQQAMGQALGK